MSADTKIVTGHQPINEAEKLKGDHMAPDSLKKSQEENPKATDSKNPKLVVEYDTPTGDVIFSESRIPQHKLIGFGMVTALEDFLRAFYAQQAMIEGKKKLQLAKPNFLGNLKNSKIGRKFLKR